MANLKVTVKITAQRFLLGPINNNLSDSTARF